MSARGASRVAVAALVAGLIVLAAPAVAMADVFNVNTTLDGGNGVCEGIAAGDCTLRDAVTDAVNGDTINVPAGNYVLSNQLGGELVLDVNVTIVGAGARQTIISGNNTSRVIRTAPPMSSTATIGMSGVTLTNGNGAGGSVTGGGAVFVDLSTTLTLTDSAVMNSSAPQGGGIYIDGNLQLNRVTVSGNQANGLSTAGAGGGIAHVSNNDPIRFAVIVDSTISGNSTNGNGGGIYSVGSALAIQRSTVADNSAASGAGIAKALAPNGQGVTVISDSIVASSSGTSCAGTTSVFSGTNNLATDGTCAVAAAANPLLSALANNGGPTNTHALAATSPAINAANPANCNGTDQRGVARPQFGACDIGAVEMIPSVLTVTTSVVNNAGGTADPGDFTLRVRLNGAEVSGSPAPGTGAGTSYSLLPGTYLVSADALRGYGVGAGGSCAADGSVALAENQAATCSVVANDPSPPSRGVNGRPVRGTVRIKLPGRKRFRVLKEGEQLPNGTTVDTLKGRIELFAAADKKGNTKSADFYDGIFKIKQGKGSKPTTTLTLVEALACNANGGKASIAAKKKKKRRLWGDGSGKFRTKGKHSAATVVGTKWLVEDRCKSTLTRVVRGRVSVRDFVKKKTVIVRRGKRYVARARS